MLEKYKLKRKIKTTMKFHKGKRHRVPHITLVYSFRLKRGVKELDIAKIIQRICKKYTLIKFHYDAFDIKKGNRGYVFAIKIKPSYELKRLRRKIYDEIKPLIDERPDLVKYNDVDEDKFWFHAAIGYRLSKEAAFQIKKNTEFKREHFPSFALRITFLRKGKIRYEYDVPTRKLLSREEALSRKYYAQTIETYRNLIQVEKSRRLPSRSSRIWFISDTHFDHANIIKYCARPFISVKEMNRILLKKWNTVVRKNDLVYFLGDMSFGRHSRKPSYWLRRLNGKVIYIKGNHEKIKLGKSSEFLEYKGHRFLLVHDPESNYVNSFDGWIIHGHKHNNDLINYPLINKERRSINVSVEVINYEPISIEQILDLISQNTKKIDTVLDV